MCTKLDYTCKERHKRTKFIDFVDFKVQKSSQFIIIVALIFRVTVLLDQYVTINFKVWYPLPMLAKLFRYDVIKRLSHGYCPMGPMENAMRAVPSHPMEHFPWTSQISSLLVPG